MLNTVPSTGASLSGWSMLSGTMRLPTGLFSAMLLGVVAMLFGLAIGVTISQSPSTIRLGHLLRRLLTMKCFSMAGAMLA
jgi:hypothetical protein